MQHTDKAWAEFEAWAGSEAFGLSPAHFAKDEAGDYINYPTQCYWLVWQASREVLEVTIEPGDCFSPNDCGDLAIWRDDAKRLLEAAGVTVRG